MKASLCPVCNGQGVVFGIAETGTMPTQTCHGCKGKGWVEVSESILPAQIYPTVENGTYSVV